MAQSEKYILFKSEYFGSMILEVKERYSDSCLSKIIYCSESPSIENTLIITKITSSNAHKYEYIDEKLAELLYNREDGDESDPDDLSYPHAFLHEN